MSVNVKPYIMHYGFIRSFLGISIALIYQRCKVRLKTQDIRYKSIKINDIG